MPKFEKMIQIGIVTDNLDEAIKQMEIFGLKGWRPMPFRAEFIPDMIIDGTPSDLAIDCAVCDYNGMEIELIQPISESVFMDWLREHGPGVHHLAFKPVDGYKSFMEEYRAMGMTHLIDAGDADGTRGFTYLDTVKQLGFYAEIHKGEPGKPEDMEGLVK